MKFSACWIVKNEAENIRTSLQSVKNCVGEMIVVDTGSTDNTVAVAKECGARVEHFAWINDFSAAKNYALSFAKGDYVIFLDGDEYFDPPLTKKDGKEFCKAFEEAGADTLRIPRYEMEKEDNTLRGIQAFDRILRRATVHYEKKVHEIPRLAGGKAVSWNILGRYKIIHTGYSQDIVMDKSRRNIAILESEQQQLDDPLAYFMNEAGLMRECMTLKEYDRAATHCEYIIKHHQHLEAVCKLAQRGFLAAYYQAVDVMEKRPRRFNRKEVYDTLFCAVKEQYPGTRDALLADLHYQIRFHYREDRFLRELAELEPKLDEAPYSEILACRQVEATIFERAAGAAHLRGDAGTTIRWAMHALMHSQYLNPTPLQMMFYHLRGNPPELFAEYILQLVDMQNSDIASVVMFILNADEYREVYEILLEKGIPPAVEDSSDEIMQGVMGAQDLDREDVFRAKAEICAARMRYAEIANHPDADYAAAKCLPCACHVAHARIILGEYDKAYDVISPHLDEGSLNQTLLRCLLVIAEMAWGRLAANARIRYENSEVILAEGVALDEVIDSGEVYKADPKKQKRAMREMTPDAFRAAYEKDRDRQVVDILLEAHERAIPVFERNNCPLMAADSYRLLIAKGRKTEQNKNHLTRLFASVGNDVLAGHIEKEYE